MQPKKKIVEKFGRIFIKKHGSNDYELLKSASFSNFDMKWYDLSGQVHPLFQKYSGRSFTMGFVTENLNSEGVSEIFKGNLLAPLKLGEITGPDMEYIDFAIKTEWDLVTKFDLVRDDPDDELGQLFLKYVGTSAFILPKEQLIRKSPFLCFIGFINGIDDMMDDLGGGVSSSCRSIRYQQMKAFYLPCMKFLRGEEKNGISSIPSWDDVDFAQIFQLPNIGLHAMLQFRRLYRCLWEVAQRVREEVLKFGMEEEGKLFVDLTVNATEAAVFEVSSEWDERDRKLFKTAQADLRRANNGMDLGLEGIAMQLGIQLRPEIRSSWIFKFYRNELSRSAGIINDLMSYNKEMLASQAEQNEVYILHVQEKRTLEDSLRTVLNEHNDSVRRILRCGDMLLNTFDNDGELVRYVDMVKEVICGGFSALAHTSRYHADLVFDCYMDENEE